jgi:hypothetical protein
MRRDVSPEAVLAALQCANASHKWCQKVRRDRAPAVCDAWLRAAGLLMNLEGRQMTGREHPDWCATTEPDGQDEHVSETLLAAESDDLIGIQLRKTQPDNETNLAMIEVEFIDYDEVNTYPLRLSQARALVEAVSRLLP